MNDQTFHIISWALGSSGSLLAFLFAVWWKIEHRQDQKIDALSDKSGREIRELHDKIDANHHAIRDRLDNIWKHISRD